MPDPDILDQLGGGENTPPSGDILSQLETATPPVTKTPEEAQSNTRQSMVAGLTGMPTPNMTEADKASFSRGKAAGAVTATAASAAPLLPEAVEAIKAAAASHPLVASLLKKALEGSALAAGAKWLHLFGSKE